MIKNFTKKMFIALTVLCMVGTGFTSCDDDDDNNNNYEYTEGEISTEEAKFSAGVAEDLARQAIRLQASWAGIENISVEKQTVLEDNELEPSMNYGEALMNAGEEGNTLYPTLIDGFDEILAGAMDISDEVGNTKITDPCNSGNVLDVESWYSYNSITDFSDNMKSVQNAYLGGIEGKRDDNKSVSKFIRSYTANGGAYLDIKIKNAISNAITKITNMPAPFREHLTLAENKDAIDACNLVMNLLDTARTLMASTAVPEMDENTQKAILEQYVNHVVIPTYKSLADEAVGLQEATATMSENGANKANNKTACEKWIKARVYWERSEAFLFGAASDYNIDPHIDSWPLDKTQLDNILVNKNIMEGFDADYAGTYLGYGLLGFHAVEYVLFRDGDARIK